VIPFDSFRGLQERNRSDFFALRRLQSADLKTSFQLQAPAEFKSSDRPGFVLANPEIYGVSGFVLTNPDIYKETERANNARRPDH
jgi:hypothetical protein